MRLAGWPRRRHATCSGVATVRNPQGGRGDVRPAPRDLRTYMLADFREGASRIFPAVPPRARKSGVVLAKSGTFPGIRAARGSQNGAFVRRMPRRTWKPELRKPLTCDFLSTSRGVARADVEKCPILPNAIARSAPRSTCCTPFAAVRAIVPAGRRAAARGLRCARRSDARPARGQPHETCTNRRRSGSGDSASTPAGAAGRQFGSLAIYGGFARRTHSRVNHGRAGRWTYLSIGP